MSLAYDEQNKRMEKGDFGRDCYVRLRRDSEP